jgi:hypothetical protein
VYHSSIAEGRSANLWTWFGNKSLLPLSITAELVIPILEIVTFEGVTKKNNRNFCHNSNVRAPVIV